MLNLLLAVAAAVIVAWLLVSRRTGFMWFLMVGALAGFTGVLVLVLSAAPFAEEPQPLSHWLTIIAVLGFYCAILGAAGGALVWLVGNLPFARRLFSPPSLDPEGDSMVEEARQAKERGRERDARRQVERELEEGDIDAALWDEAAASTGGVEARRRKRYVDARVRQLLDG